MKIVKMQIQETRLFSFSNFSIPETEDIMPEKLLLGYGCEIFRFEFGALPEIAACAPGKVNLMGEHVDYNDGFVLPMALQMVTILVGKKNGKKTINLMTIDNAAGKPNRIEFPIPAEQKLKPSKDPPRWAEYVKGTIANFEGEVPGFDALIISSIPIGGGLSSSAALEVATYTFLEALTHRKTESPLQKVLNCHKAEHDYVGVPCGVMDQFVSVMGQPGKAIFIDCRLNEAHWVPIESKDYIFLITNSNASHEVDSRELPSRVIQCAEAARILNKPKLRDATIADLEDARKNGLIEDDLFKRARHVITEIERTKKAAKALEKGQLEDFGNLMYESHRSLREDYEVSCDELDELVAAAKEVKGVLGSKMTGEGFGGCIVTLVAKNKVSEVVAHIKKKYSKKPIFEKPFFYIAKPSQGAHVMTIPK